MYNRFQIYELRIILRMLFPETRGSGKLAHIGSRLGMEEYLSDHNTTIEECKQALNEYNNKNKGTTEKMENENHVNESENRQENNVVSDSVLDLQKALSRIISENKNESNINTEIIKDMINERIQEMEERFDSIIDDKFENNIKTIEIKKIDSDEIKKIGICHKDFEKVLHMTLSGVNVMLTGPAGSGKTFTAQKIAEAMELNFYPLSVGSQTTKSDLLGFIDAGGNYRRTIMRDAFENGGLFLLDEMDSGNSNVLTIINNLLSGDVCAFPDGIIKKHKDFHVICACNTYGRGADSVYCGRNQLDGSTLNRFSVFYFGYDEKLELEISSNERWTKCVQSIRHNAENIKARIIISPRASIDGGKLLSAGFTVDEVKNMVIFKGIDESLKMKIDSEF